MISRPFLKEIAEILVKRPDYDPSLLCIVFPNKRARLYLSRYIGEIISRPLWAPRYFTISELMETISGYHVADRLTLLFELYDSYAEGTGSIETFDSFFPYGETLLADFDEIDKYLVDAKDLFRNLSDLKNLEGKFKYLTEEQLDYIRRFWSAFNSGRTVEGHQGFISLWESLYTVYTLFVSKLKEQNLAYEGMAYRKAVENPEGIEVIGKDAKFVFVGFNALSVAEDRLLMNLKNSGRAEFFWDYDSVYLDEVHEAGTFIRKNLNRFPEKHIVSHNHFFDEDHKEIKKNQVSFIPVYSNTGQALILPEILKRLETSGAGAAEKTAIVLADEGLLINALYAVPQDIEDINVTMGYPLSNSAIFGLIDSLFELGSNSRKNSKNETAWYLTDILSVMNNPLLRKKYEVHSGNVTRFALEKHKVFLSTAEILPGADDDPVFKDELKTDTINYLVGLITTLIREPYSENRKPAADPVQLEMLFSVYLFLTRLHDILEQRSTTAKPDTLFRLIKRMLRGMRIPFSGEPLAGLQILGILETRTLDFDNVIILSANEGVLPASSDKPSFIPYNLRSGFGMPTPEHHDAIYAYYFYRLIQRARNIALVYDASSGGLQTGERSRFLHQLLYDMKLKITELHVESSISQIPVKDVVIRKTDDVYKALSVYLGVKGRPLSPSAINEYINCPVKFYFHYIAGLKQPEEAGEEVDARLFGNLIHNALQRIYSWFGTEVVTAQKIRNVHDDEKLIREAIKGAFCDELFGDKDGTENRKPEGYNLIVEQVLFTYIRQFLKSEMKSAPFTLISLEEKYYATVPIRASGAATYITVGGVIDRIDLKNGLTRILDYKTGDVKSKFSTIESLFDTHEKKRSDAVFQVLLYCYVYHQLQPDAKIVPGLFFLRQTHQENFSESITIGPATGGHGAERSRRIDDFSMVEQEFESNLKTVAEELFNRDMPFIQTENMKICGYCSYKGICRR